MVAFALALKVTFTLAFTLTLGTTQVGPVAPAPAAPAAASAKTPPRVVLISGEDEYDSEVSLSALAHLLAERHGMTTSLAASHSPESVRGLEALASADLAIVFVRNRAWPEAECKRLNDFIARGGALVALRTTASAFAYPADSPLAAENNSFGVKYFGTAWQWDHGPSSSTDVVITPRPRYKDDHELLRAVPPSFHVRSALAHVLPLPDDVNLLARGTPVNSEHDKSEHDKQSSGGKDGGASPTNIPDANPVAWTRTRPDGGRTFYTSMGHPDDFDVPEFRRLLLNGILWTTRVSTPANPRLPPPPLKSETEEALDISLPIAKPLTDFEISTAYASDWSKPIADQHFPPEEGIAGFNDVQWIKITTPNGAVDFRRFDPTSKQGTIYAKTTIHIASARQLELVLQSDDGLELYVDHKSRFIRQELRTLLTGCECIPLQLDPGDHELMFKVMNAGGTWGVRARVRDLTEYRGLVGKPR